MYLCIEVNHLIYFNFKKTNKMKNTENLLFANRMLKFITTEIEILEDEILHFKEETNKNVEDALLLSKFRIRRLKNEKDYIISEIEKTK